MAEQEVTKHTKKIYKIWTSKEHSFWHKLKEFIIEIFIIVFAITVSLWFHNRSEHQHQQADVKEFLLGLKEDLTADIKEMKDDKNSYLKQYAAFAYITGIKPGEKPNPDSINHYSLWMYTSTSLNPNNGRYEGFKSSGKIGLIEDETLQNDIMDLYQENIPSLLASTNGYVGRKQVLFEYLNHSLKRTSDSTNNLPEVINTEEAHNICTPLSFTNEITSRYDSAIAKMEKIIVRIDKAYNR